MSKKTFQKKNTGIKANHEIYFTDKPRLTENGSLLGQFKRNLNLVPGTAIGTLYRRLLAAVRKEKPDLTGPMAEGRIYDTKVDGRWEDAVDVLFEDLFAYILPEAMVGNCRIGLEDGHYYASCDFYFQPGKVLRDHNIDFLPYKPEREMNFEIDRFDRDEPVISVGWNYENHPDGKVDRVRIYPEDLGTLRETLLARFNFSIPEEDGWCRNFDEDLGE